MVQDRVVQVVNRIFEDARHSFTSLPALVISVKWVPFVIGSMRTSDGNVSIQQSRRRFPLSSAALPGLQKSFTVGPRWSCSDTTSKLMKAQSKQIHKRQYGRPDLITNVSQKEMENISWPKLKLPCLDSIASFSVQFCDAAAFLT